VLSQAVKLQPGHQPPVLLLELQLLLIERIKLNQETLVCAIIQTKVKNMYASISQDNKLWSHAQKCNCQILKEKTTHEKAIFTV